MNQYGRRLIYNTSNGEILNSYLGEMYGYVKDGLRPKEINYLDLPFGYNENNFKDAILYHIDISKDIKNTEIKDLIIIDEYIKRKETEEEKLQKEKIELENQLLLKENKDLGGIL